MRPTQMLLRAAWSATAVCTLIAATGAQAQTAQTKRVQAQAPGAPTPAQPATPATPAPGRSDPNPIPDPHPSGKTSDEGSTRGSVAPEVATPPQTVPSATAPGSVARPPSAGGGAYSGRKSTDPNDPSNRRLPATRSPQQP